MRMRSSLFLAGGSIALVVSLAGCGGGGGGSSSSTPASPALQFYLVMGNVTGLNPGATATLTDNGTDSVTVAANGEFQFKTAVATGSPYALTISAQPQGEACAVVNAAGMINGANITDIAVVCSAFPTSGEYVKQSVQYNSYPGDNSPSWTVTLINVQAGSTLYVVGTWPNFHSKYPTMRVTDGTNTYTLLDRYDDTAQFNLGMQGTQSMAHWSAANVPAGTYAINMSPVPQTFEDWVGLVAFEVAGVSANPLDGHALSFQAVVPKGTNTVDATVTNVRSSGILIAVTFEDIDFTAPTGALIGTGFTDAGLLWDFSKSGKPAAHAEYSVVSSAGQHVATFDPQEGGPQSPDYMTCAAIFN